MLVLLRCGGAACSAQGAVRMLRHQPLASAVRGGRWLCSGPAGATPPASMSGRLRARVLSALQKDGSKQLDASLPLGYAQNLRTSSKCFRRRR